MSEDGTVHDVELDFAGWGGHPRYTCYTCKGSTLLRQPYMSAGQWDEARTAYFGLHPCTHVRRGGELVELRPDKESRAL